MKLSEFKTQLESLGFPVAYDHFEKPQKTPCIVYKVPGSDNFAADGKVYCKVEQLDVELYTDFKSLATEAKVEKLLDSCELVYERTESYFESEKLYEVLYEMEVLLDAEEQN
ncbi:MAG: hypothetical protein PUI53_00260 [Butyricicoccus porcorum]|nr:hypothetical protein [Butyricicoccus porcorum]